MNPSLPRLGPRGEGWLILQITLSTVVAIAGLVGPRWGPPARPWLVGTAVLLGVAGLAFAVAAIVALGRLLTPLPRPMSGGAVRDRGPYGLVRHPIYGGALLAGIAWCLATSPIAFAPFALATLFIVGKARVEEAFLLERYPEYTEYMRRVRRRFVPFLW